MVLFQLKTSPTKNKSTQGDWHARGAWSLGGWQCLAAARRLEFRKAQHGLLGLACTLSPQARRPAELFSLSAFAWFTGLCGSARPKSQESRRRLQATGSAGHSHLQPRAQPSMDLLFSAPSQRQVPLHCSSRRQIPTSGIHRTRQQPKRS